jgi:ribosome-associated protein
MAIRKKEAELKQQVALALAAAEEKQAERISVLELDKAAGGFTDFFIICSGSNPRQIQAISDEVEQRLGKSGLRPAHVEGYKQAEWVLLDYVDFVVHVFADKAREFYDLERLWKSAKRLDPSELKPGARKKRAAKPRAATKTEKPARPRSRARKTPAS